MSGVTLVTITSGDDGLRLDRWFKDNYPGLSKGRLEKLLRTGQIRINGKRVKSSARLEAGQELRVPPLSQEKEAKAGPASSATKAVSDQDREMLHQAVLYKDKQVIVLDKPAGLAVQGGSGQSRHLDGMLSALKYEMSERPKLVHRLDQDTAGVLMLARNLQAARFLTGELKGDGPRKIYWALVAGVPQRPKGLIDLPLGKAGGQGSEKMVVDAPNAKDARTRYAVVASKGRQASWVALRPLTGRTHQLRAHMAALGHPILGDGKYGGKDAYLSRTEIPKNLMLQAHELAIAHPEDGVTLRVEAPIPAHFVDAFAALGLDPANPLAQRACDWLENPQG
ncbi:RluA family pseudouridine synthase [Rhodovibrionaceae bacterium A322]